MQNNASARNPLKELARTTELSRRSPSRVSDSLEGRAGPVRACEQCAWQAVPPTPAGSGGLCDVRASGIEAGLNRLGLDQSASESGDFLHLPICREPVAVRGIVQTLARKIVVAVPVEQQISGGRRPTAGQAAARPHKRPRAGAAPLRTRNQRRSRRERLRCADRFLESVMVLPDRLSSCGRLPGIRI